MHIGDSAPPPTPQFDKISINFREKVSMSKDPVAAALCLSGGEEESEINSQN